MYNTTIPLNLKYLCAFIVVYLILVQRSYSLKASHVCPDRINGMDLKFNTVACFILSLIEKPSVQCKITACLCFTHSLLWLQGSSKYMKSKQFPSVFPVMILPSAFFHSILSLPIKNSDLRMFLRDKKHFQSTMSSPNNKMIILH